MVLVVVMNRDEKEEASGVRQMSDATPPGFTQWKATPEDSPNLACRKVS